MTAGPGGRAAAPDVGALVETIASLHGRLVDPSSTLTPGPAQPARGTAESGSARPGAPRPAGSASLSPSLAALPLVALDGDTSRGGLDLELLGVIGEGGMGRVLLARQPSLGREVAVKMLRPEVASRATVEALLVEARHIGALEHPNIVPVHALARTEDGQPVLVMKRVEGVPWRTLIHETGHVFWRRHGGDRLDFHLDVLQQVCNAAYFAHSRGLVHRDIKPANVMIGEFGEVYLVDWGLAIDCKRARERPSSQVVGTPGYLAPEMLGGTAGLSPATDVYLLGATLHEVLTGERRHKGADLLSALTAAAESLPVAYAPSVPAELAAICNRATARDPDERFPTALALREAVADFRLHRGSIELARRAANAFAALRDGKRPQNDDSIRKAVSDSRLQFEQALRIWSDNGEARDGLQSLLEWMIDFELQRRNRGSAASLLADLPEPRPELDERLSRLDGELRDEQQAAARLSELRRQGDFTTAQRVRSLLLSLILFALAGLSALRAFVSGSGAAVPRPEWMLQLSAAGVVATFIIWLVLRPALRRSRVNAQFFLAVVLIGAVSTLLAVLCFIGNWPFATFLVGHALIATTVVLSLAIFVHRWLAPVAAGPLFVAVLATLYPASAQDFQTIGFLVAAGSFALIYKRTRSMPE